MAGGDQVTLEAHTLALVLEPEDSPIHRIGLGLDDVEIAVFIQVAVPDLDRQAVAVGPVAAGRVQAGMLCPLQPFAVNILKPHVAANDIVVPIAVDIADACRSDAAVYAAAYFMLDPLFARIDRDLVPDRDFVVLLIAAGNHVELAVAVDVGRYVVMTDDSAAVECLEGLCARFAGVAVPSGAAELIDPSVAVDVEGRAAHVGTDALTQVMLNPLLRADVLEPPRPGPLPDHPVEIAIFVDIDQRRLAHAPAHFRDLVILKFRKSRIGQGAKHTNHDNNSRQTQNISTVIIKHLKFLPLVIDLYLHQLLDMLEVGRVFDIDSQASPFGVFPGVFQLCNKLLRQVTFFYHGNSLFTKNK